MKYKICTKCKKELPATLEYFHNKKEASDGLKSRCKKCCREDYKIYREENKEEVNRKERERYHNDAEKERSRNRKRYHDNIEKERARSKKYYEENKEKELSRTNKYKEENEDWYIEYCKNYYKDNKQKILKQQKRRRKEKKEEISEYIKQWKKENKDLVNFYYAKYRAAKLNATPDWLTENHWDNIKMYYELRELSPSMHVDHITPLQGENVCGLHVPWNLQLMPGSENLSKSNKLEGRQ